MRGMWRLAQAVADPKVYAIVHGSHIGRQIMKIDSVSGRPVALIDPDPQRGNSSVRLIDHANDYGNVRHENIKEGTLVALDVGARAEGAELFITYPRDHGASAKIRALADSLKKNFGDPPYWER